jgi:hypothetical protein
LVLWQVRYQYRDEGFERTFLARRRYHWGVDHRASTSRVPSGIPLRHTLSFLTVLFTIAACAVGPRLMNETPSGGTVVYPFSEEQDILSSSGRRDALRLLNDKCRGAYRVEAEGELAKVGKNIDKAWSGQISTDRMWGIQFSCKE